MDQSKGFYNSDNAEGILTLKIEKFSDVFKEGETFTSEKLNFMGLKWFIKVKCCTNDDKSLSLSYYLYCEAKCKGWTCSVSAEMKILTQNSKFRSMISNFNHIFNYDNDNRGYQKFISYNEILKRKYLRNNCLFLETKVKVQKPLGIVSIETPYLKNSEYQEKFVRLFEDENSADIEFKFKVRGKKTKILKAHKLILILTSDWFEDHFKNNQESSIEIKDYTFDCFKDFLSFLYHSEVNLEAKSADHIIDLYDAFVFYKIHKGTKYIQYYFQTNSRLEEVLRLSVWLTETSMEQNDAILKKTSEAFIIKHAKTVLEEMDLSKTSISTACQIVKIAFSQMYDDHEMCFDALKRYYENRNVSKNIFNVEMLPAIEIIRWKWIDFAVILKADLFTDSTKVLILRCIENNNYVTVRIITSVIQKIDDKSNENKSSKQNNEQMSKLHGHLKSQDVSFKFGEQIVKAHKAILAMNSEVFDAMFYGELKETGIIEITDIKIEIFELMLKLLYLQSIDLFNETSDTLYDLYAALHKYQCTNALDFLKTFIINRKEDIFLFYEMAQNFLDRDLEFKCYTLLQSPASNVNSTYFLSAKPETINAIFTRDDLKDFPDTARLHAIECYIEANIHENPEIRQNIMESTLKINFDEIQSYKMLTSNSLNDSQKLEIYSKKKNKVKE
ncbi:uncharacterized protein LOC134838177 isoform X2 [Culicoides brevitarsis]|uniref:uncharacterized protein LOC134838177 isoform X2 n=1 Tax=Culicoides brevitarsis TaxID=469753 RepID=UPI00307B47FD